MGIQKLVVSQMHPHPQSKQVQSAGETALSKESSPA